MLRLEPWNRTLLAVAAAQFIALGGGNLVFPFLPFYVEDLGISGEGKIALWTGVLTTATGSMLFIFSPIWGGLADRFGRKPLLLRAYIGAMFTMTLQGLAQNVWQMLALRALQGAFVGTIPAATALIATSVPKERMAYAMGVLQMALFTSRFIGPLVGGVLAASIGIRPTFIGASAFYLLAFLLVFTVVDEQFERPTAEERGSFIANLRLVLSIRPLLILIGLVFFLHAGPAYIRPVIPLMVDSFDSTLSAVSLSGIAFSAMAVTSAIAALSAARLSGRIGYRNALALATLGAGAAYLPVAIAANVPTLLILIGVVGLFSGRDAADGERALRAGRAAGPASCDVRCRRQRHGAGLRGGAAHGRRGGRWRRRADELRCHRRDHAGSRGSGAGVGAGAGEAGGVAGVRLARTTAPR